MELLFMQFLSPKKKRMFFTAFWFPWSTEGFLSRQNERKNKCQNFPYDGDGYLKNSCPYCGQGYAPKEGNLGIHVSETSSEGGYIFSQFVCGIFCFKIAAHENWRHPFSIQKEAHIFHTCLEWMSLDASKKWDCLHLFPFESFTHGQNIEKKVFCD